MDESILKKEKNIWTILNRYFYKMFYFFIIKNSLKITQKCFNRNQEDYKKKNSNSYVDSSKSFVYSYALPIVFFPNYELSFAHNLVPNISIKKVSL